MSRFFVGQRVRVIRARTPHGSACVGLETKILSFICDDYVRIAGGLPTPPDGADHWNCYTWQLEPLTDPGREVIAWQDCCWKPQHLRSRVEVGP